MANKKTLNMYDNDTLKWERDGKLYCLHVQNDSDPLNPRKDWDNPGTVMACWHRRYSLGDEIQDKEPEDFWQRMVRENVPEDEIFEAAKAGKLPGIRLSACKGHGKKGLVNIYETYQYRTVIGNSEPEEHLEYEEVEQDAVASYLMDDLTISHCMVLMEPYAVWLNLWLYDHSGITMSCGAGNPFTCPWDSGQVGWIVTTKKSAIKEIGYTEADWKERSMKLMEAEVSEYDQYLTGDVYGFTLYSADPVGDDDESLDWSEEDSCWGFFGSNILENGIEDHVGSGLWEAIEAGTYEEGTAKLCTASYYAF